MIPASPRMLILSLQINVVAMDAADQLALLNHVLAFNAITNAIFLLIRARRRNIEALMARMHERERERMQRARYCISDLPHRGEIWEILRGNEEKCRIHLRVSQQALRLLVSKMERKRHGWENELEAIIFLYWLACGTSFRVISTTFDVPRSSVHTAVRRMLAVMEGLFRSVVTLPTHQELEGIGLDFAAKAGSDTFSKCVGAIDGSHVRVFSPRGMNEAYINRKLFYSLQMQVLCIGSGKIIDFYAGECWYLTL
ncbi:uncharacterized protein LOC124173228 [Ischnura elegans]|uniref:uncharacterized protein LOC124173228 n=1 Tax=Ischnura elegans TaxID=197161 RepID=UPI001ED88BB5|nr:uncharacterized protein LOC124173228 [Ischnura elegans]